VHLLSKEGKTTSLPVSFMMASSPFIQSMLTPAPSCSCQWSTTNSISVPSCDSTIKLLVQILCKGETDQCAGLQTTMASLKELQELIAILGMNVNVGPMLKSVKGTKGSDLTEIKDEVVDSVDNWEVSGHVDDIGDAHTKQQQVKKAAMTARKSSAGVRFKQSGLLRDFKVNLVKHRFDGGINNEKEGQNNNKYKSGNESQSSRSKCNICGADFANLRRHYREKHGVADNMEQAGVNKLNENKCPKCGFKFSSRGRLLSHFRRKHKKPNVVEKFDVNHSQDCIDTMYQCPDCDLKYSSRDNLDKHKCDKHQAGGSESKYQCKDCDFKYSSRSNLKRHRFAMHLNDKGESGDKGESVNRIKCSACEKTYFDQNGLKRHMEREHEGITYGCGVCNHITLFKNSMYRHCKSAGHDSSLIYKIVDFPR